MAKAKYLTGPIPSSKMPGGIPYIIGNEFAERFSFYGMKGILVIFMTTYLLGRQGESDFMGEIEATRNYHLFTSAVYFTPLLGALISDIFFGKFRTIIALSLVYCLGHFVLAIDDTRFGLAIGLGLIAIGAGGIKPCVSAHVGDQFGKTNEHLISRIFGWFYMSINLGAFISILLTPWLLKHHGSSWAFGVPGVLMLLATLCFWMGRNKFVHIPPGGIRWVKETLGREGLKAIGKLSIIFTFVAMFWALFDQTGSTWVLQALDMDRSFFGYEVLPSQIQAANPLLIVLMIPLFFKVIYPAVNRVYRLTALRKVAIGFFVTIPAFAIPAWIELRIGNGETPHISWQLLAYVLMTTAEVMISITCLEFAYTQAPKTMKSLIMSFYLVSVSIGNLFTAAVNFFIENEDGTSKLEGASYYWFFTALIAATAVAFLIVAKLYREKTYIQDETARIV
ncbi:MAG: POT family MFS transporter [Planctomycetota bacterium]|nr:POT family MFS transporter [Planctomycetota bacterium]